MWRGNGEGGLQSSISYRFKWIMKSNGHIAFKFLQVRCNLQAGHLEKPLSQIKSSHCYWCGNYSRKKEQSRGCGRGEGLGAQPQQLHCRQIRSVSLSLPPVKPEIVTVTGSISVTYQKVSLNMEDLNLCLWRFKRLWYWYKAAGNLFFCWSSPISRARVETRNLEKGLAVPVFLCVSMPLGI